MNGTLVDRFGRLFVLFFSATVIVLLGLTIREWIHRPMWADEITAMTNYPLPDPFAAFEPLPYYSQAAPPLFNLVSSILALLPLEWARLVLFGLVAASFGAVVWATYRRFYVVAAAAIALFLFPQALHYATELKYYGFEMIGAAILISWFLRKDYWAQLTGRDIAILTLGMVCGISTIILTGVALGLFAIGFLFDSRKTDRGQLVLVILFVTIAAGYYLIIRHVTHYQINNFPDAYSFSGFVALRRALGALNLGWSLILIGALSFLVMLFARERARLFKIGILFGTVVLAMLMLATLGLYPAYDSRQVIWISAFPVLAFVELAWIGAHSWTRGRAWIAVVVVALAIFLAGRVAWHTVATGEASYKIEDSRSLAEWLEQQPPREIGLWIGGVAFTSYYRPRSAQIDKHKYYGMHDIRSGLIDDRLFDPAFLKRDPEAIRSYLERNRYEPGASSRIVVYRILDDYTGYARSLFDELPTGRTVYILAFHANLSDENSRTDALMGELSKRRCDWRPAAEFEGAFVLEVTCPHRHPYPSSVLENPVHSQDSGMAVS